MATYAIEIDDTAITEQINAILDRLLQIELRSRYSDSGRVMSEAIKDLIYSHKDEIIEMVVDRASREVVKKSLPKLIERIGD